MGTESSDCNTAKTNLLANNNVVNKRKIDV